VDYNLPAVVLQLVTNPVGSVTPTDFYLFGTLKKHLAGKQFAADTDVQHALTSWLQTLDNDFFYTDTNLHAIVGQMLECQW
jgi:hypothetical protein